MARVAALVLVVVLLFGAALTPDARPAPKMEYPLLIAAISSVGVAIGQAFGQLDASIRVAAMILPPQRITCRATIGNRALKGTSYFRPGRAGCRWAIPLGSRGKTVTGSVSVRVNGKTVVKRFTKRIK
jgi:hypothetical protein